MATRTRALAVSGRVDRLDRRVVEGADGGEQLVVVDYKTGRRVLTAYDVRSSLALALYALAVTRTFRRPCLRVELHHLPTGDVVGHDHTPETLQRHLDRAESIGSEAGAAEAAVKAAADTGSSCSRHCRRSAASSGSPCRFPARRTSPRPFATTR